MSVGKLVRLAALPVVVNSVPVVGRVSAVVLVMVSVVANEPEMVSVDAALFAMPVPP